MARPVNPEAAQVFSQKLDALGIAADDLGAALSQFQQAHGLKVTGNPDRDTAVALNKEIISRLGPTPQGLNPVAEMQYKLGQLGKYDGPVDGNLTSASDAIMKYQRTHVPPLQVITGRPNPEMQRAVDDELAQYLTQTHKAAPSQAKATPAAQQGFSEEVLAALDGVARNLQLNPDLVRTAARPSWNIADAQPDPGKSMTKTT